MHDSALSNFFRVCLLGSVVAGAALAGELDADPGPGEPRASASMSSGAASRAAPLRLVAGQNHYILGTHLEILEDPERRHTIETVSDSDFPGSWTRSTATSPAFGYTQSAYWARLRIERAPDASRDWLLECALPAMDLMTLYRRGPDGWEAASIGDSIPFGVRELRHRNGILRLRMKATPDAPETIYLRFATEGIVQMSLGVWSPEAFAEKVGEEQYGLGLYYGVLLAMIVYNFFLFFAVRDRSYLYYVFYILCFALMMLSVNGLAFQFLWPDWPLWANRSIILFAGLTTIAVVMFTRNFLRTWEKRPLLDRSLLGLAVLGWIMAAAGILLTYSIMVRVTAAVILFCSPILVYAGVRSYLDGFRPARYFLLAWAGLLVGIIAFVLKNVGVLPAVFITEYGMQLGSVLEVLLLSMALGDRINLLRVEKNEAARLLNDSLEEQVGARTRELHTALLELRRAHAALQEKDYYMQNELDLAAKIQRGILPPAVVDVNGIRALTHYESFEKVGGDFLAVEPAAGGRLAIFIADVSGHGIPAALLTTITRIGFSEALRRFSSPAKILADINVSVRHTVKSDEFLTAFCVMIESDYSLNYSSAGHHHGFLLRRRRGVADRMETPGAVIGLVDDLTVPFEDKKDRLEIGDRLFLFTDGIVEAMNDREEVFGRRRLYEALIDSQEQPLEKQKDWILFRWRDFIGTREVQDDVSFILLEVVAPGD